MESEKERCIRFKDLKAEPDHMLHAKSCQTYILTRASPYTVRIPKRGQHRIAAYAARIPTRKTPYTKLYVENTTRIPKKQPCIPTVYQKEQFPYTSRISKGKLPVYQAYTNLSAVFHIIFFLSFIHFIINKLDIIIIFFTGHFLQDLQAAQKQSLLIETMMFKAIRAWSSIPAQCLWSGWTAFNQVCKLFLVGWKVKKRNFKITSKIYFLL